MPNREPYYELDSDSALQRHVKLERERARNLRKTQWWSSLLNAGTCHYCHQVFPPQELTMDHIVPLARKGKSTKGNVVPACQMCNRNKRLDTPVEVILDRLKDTTS